jgi:hypothetical protein
MIDAIAKGPMDELAKAIDGKDEVAFDAGLQLGSSAISPRDKSAEDHRRRVAEGVVKLESRMRETARRLTDEMLQAWTAFARGGP